MSVIHQQQLIGQGTFGSVFLVRNRNHETVAMKVVKKSSAQKPSDMEREFQAGKILKHKSIVDVKETYEDQRNWYMVMQHIEGENLFHYVHRNMDENGGDLKLSESCTRRIFKQLIKAMEYAHSNGVAHLDLKLENIMIQNHKKVKIIDFGLCQIQSDITEMCTRFVGSPDYIAPEILLRQPFRPDKADVWSLGVILYILMTGEIPFSRKERKAFQRGETDHPELMWDSKKLPKQAKNLIQRMLSVDPEERPTLSKVRKHPWLSKWSL